MSDLIERAFAAVSPDAWTAGPAATPDTVRLRLRKGTCPACGLHAPGRHRVCAACRDAGRDICPRCLRIVAVAELDSRREACRPCRRTQARKARGYATPEAGRAAMVAGAKRGQATATAQRVALSREMTALSDAGLSNAEIAARYGVSENAVRLRLGRWRRELARPKKR